MRGCSKTGWRYHRIHIGQQLLKSQTAGFGLADRAPTNEETWKP
jgi:hypothetical protein